MILGAVGTGKTSACMYPYVDQLLRWRSDDRHAEGGRAGDGGEGRLLSAGAGHPARTADATRTTSRSGSTPASATTRCTTTSIPYAVAYAIATLLNNLFGRSKEPFWQQAYTDLLKFVILLRRLTDGYTTFSEVYRYILDDSQIDRDIRRLKTALAEPPDCLLIRHGGLPTCSDPALVDALVRGRRRPHGAPVRCRARDVPGCARWSYEVRSPQGTGWAARKHQLEALERWYLNGWSRLDARLRSSITEGVVVFLSLFDDNPAVHRAFCPPRSAYTGDAAGRGTASRSNRSTR